jgi:esterase/lipase superfamily enzyme
MIKREYNKSYSSFLQRDMEILIFGDGGKPVIFFPTRTARFYDYEDWKVIEALQPKIQARELQIICVDSTDAQSFYNKSIHPSERIKQHLLFEKYILFELLPFIKQKNNNPYVISAGCSLGAYHAANIAFRYPQFFKKMVAMSGRYDLTLKLQYFDDLFEGYFDENIYLNTPSKYIPNLQSEQAIRILNKLDIIIAIGKEDAFLQNNLLLHNSLDAKGIKHQFNLWNGEAHKAQYWREMVKMYL